MPRLIKIVLLLAVIIGCAWLQYLFDDGLGIGWPSDAVRNWQQFGFSNLHGQLVTNPGGFEVAASPNIYKGMSPVCLYPAYFITRFFAWTGLDTMAFQIVMSLLVFWAIWNLLGRDNFALFVAAVAIFCPGYSRWLKILDPNVITVLFGLPYIALVASILKRPRLGFASGLSLFAVTMTFVSLNWTTAWVLGPCALLLLGLPQINRRAVFLFISLAGASSILFVLGSAIIKAGGSQASPEHLGRFIRGYTWGNVGYGAGLTTSKAFMRLVFVNGIGLLPLLVVCGGVAVKCLPRGGGKNWYALTPLALTVLEVGFMRNYFGHHPWMAAPVLLVGLVFSLVLLRVHPESSSAAPGRMNGSLLLPAIVLVCFIYSLAVVEFFRANGLNGLTLAGLVRHHTERSDWIVVVKSIDPQTTEIAPRLDEHLDRHVLVVDDLDHLPAGRDFVILSAVPAGGLGLRAQASVGGPASQSLLQKTGDWFNHSIARRQPGDRIDFAGTYFLYETKP